MLRLRLSNVLDEQLEGLAWPVVLPAGRMAERGERTGSFVDGLLHLLLSFTVTTLHCAWQAHEILFPTIENSIVSFFDLSLDWLMTGSAEGNVVRVVMGTLRARLGAGLVILHASAVAVQCLLKKDHAYIKAALLGGVPVCRQCSC